MNYSFPDEEQTEQDNSHASIGPENEEKDDDEFPYGDVENEKLKAHLQALIDKYT